MEVMSIFDLLPEDEAAKYSKVNYVCGMSVPPVMIKRIVQRLIESGCFDESK